MAHILLVKIGSFLFVIIKINSNNNNNKRPKWLKQYIKTQRKLCTK